MYRFEHRRFRLRPLPRWKLALIGAVAVALAIALAIVTASLLLILVPVVLVAVLLYRLFAPRPPRPEHPARIIETDYEVIDIEDSRRNRRP